MYGKHFESMYEGSMYGAGIAVFAVWGYVIAHAKEGRVELNAKKLSHTLGGSVEEIDSAIAFLMQPDAASRCKEHDGRRLIKEGEFQYFLPSWEKYQLIRSQVDRREYNRVKQAEHRAKLAAQNGKPKRKSKSPVGNPAGEDAYVRAAGAGASDAQLDSIVAESLPPEPPQAANH